MSIGAIILSLFAPFLEFIAQFMPGEVFPYFFTMEMIGYFVYRNQPETSIVKNNAAILGLSGMLMVPLSYLSSRFLRSHHPVIVGTEDQGSLDPSLRLGLYMGLFGFLLIFIFLFNTRMMIEKMERDMLSTKMEKM